MFKSSVVAIPRAIQLDGANKKSAKRIGLQSVFGDQGIPDICIFSATVVVTNISTRGRQSKLFLGSYASDPYIYICLLVHPLVHLLVHLPVSGLTKGYFKHTLLQPGQHTGPNI